jgi:hypothetical protein
VSIVRAKHRKNVIPGVHVAASRCVVGGLQAQLREKTRSGKFPFWLLLGRKPFKKTHLF